MGFKSGENDNKKSGFVDGNQFIHDRNNKRLGINLLVKSCGINLALCSLLYLLISKLVLKPIL
jgi:hypothetical protein